MASRLELQRELREILGSDNVYYQPPESLKMKYPCIRYSLSDVAQRRANNKTYNKYNRYQLIVISKNSDDMTVDKLLNHFEMIDFDRPYVSDNLYHFSLNLYY